MSAAGGPWGDSTTDKIVYQKNSSKGSNDDKFVMTLNNLYVSLDCDDSHLSHDSLFTGLVTRVTK
jgi:hypothetical protein